MERNKAEGKMLQIFWKRGSIGPTIEPTKAESFYINDGKKDALRNLILGTSLRMMISSLKLCSAMFGQKCRRQVLLSHCLALAT